MGDNPTEAISYSKAKARGKRMREVEAKDVANLRKVGRPKKILDNKKIDIKGFPSGTSTAYALRRLRKHKPELHERVLAGELTANAAMIEADFRKRVQALIELALPQLAFEDAPAIGAHGGDRRAEQGYKSQNITLNRGTSAEFARSVDKIAAVTPEARQRILADDSGLCFARRRRIVAAYWVPRFGS